MPGPSERDLRREIDDLRDEIDSGAGRPPIAVVYADAETGEWYDSADLEGDPLDSDSPAVDPLMILERGGGEV